MSNIDELNFWPVKSSSISPEGTSKELQSRLSLYQVFVKLYENHGSLLEQILQLENLSTSSLNVAQSHYIQAVVDGETVYVTTNLRDGKSQSLRQSQNIWTIGRDRNSGIHLNNKYVSRRHAAIRYIEQGFYLVDFNSTNGTFVNSEQIYHPTKLEEGDIIRIGNMTFSFFINRSCSVLPTVAVELLMQLIPKTGDNHARNDKTEPLHPYYKSKTKTRKLGDSEYIQEDTDCERIVQMQTLEEQLSQEWKSEILDRFYSNQPAKNQV
ncbi:MAG: FHA domain-containing protein [Cyanobacteria bacterium P01_C01_bin.38]